MTPNHPSQLVPKMRFPEFRDSPAWSSQPLEGVCEVLNNRRVPITAKDRKTGPYPYYGASGIVDYVDDFIFDERLLLVGEDGAKWRCFEQTAFIAEGKYWVNNHAHVLRPVALIDSVLGAYLVRSDLSQYVTGAAPPKLTLGKLKTIPIPIPSSQAEQQKIADCLGSLDDLIAAEVRKLEVLRRHKQGLMQRLFPRDGESVPRLRFPEFENAGDWEWKPLGKVAEIKLGKMLDKNKHRSGHLLPYLNNLAVRWNDFDTSNLPRMYFTDSDLAKYALRKGDVVVCEGGEPGRAAVWDERVPNMKFQKALHRVRFTESFVPQLLVHYLETVAGTDSFESMFTGGGIKHLTRKAFAGFEVPVAIPAEQLRIAACLSVIQEQIQSQQSRVQLLAMHETGLLQQLFPSVEVFTS